MAGTKEGAAKRSQTFKKGNKAAVKTDEGKATTKLSQSLRKASDPIRLMRQYFHADPEILEKVLASIIKKSEEGDLKASIYLCDRGLKDPKTMASFKWGKPLLTLEDKKAYEACLSEKYVNQECSLEEWKEVSQTLQISIQMNELERIKELVEELKANKYK